MKMDIYYFIEIMILSIIIVEIDHIAKTRGATDMYFTQSQDGCILRMRHVFEDTCSIHLKFRIKDPNSTRNVWLPELNSDVLLFMGKTLSSALNATQIRDLFKLYHYCKLESHMNASRNRISPRYTKMASDLIEFVPILYNTIEYGTLRDKEVVWKLLLYPLVADIQYLYHKYPTFDTNEYFKTFITLTWGLSDIGSLARAADRWIFDYNFLFNCISSFSKLKSVNMRDVITDEEFHDICSYIKKEFMKYE